MTAATATTAGVTVGAKPLNYSGISANGKVYDGTTTAALTGSASTLASETAGSGTAADGKPITGDTVSFTTGTLTGTFASGDAANGIAVTLTGGVTLTAGGQSVNYSVGSPSPALTANITPKPLTYTGVSVPASKVYDGTATAFPTGSPSLGSAESPAYGSGGDGLPYTGDSASIGGLPSAMYNSPDVATANTVTFGLGSLVISARDASDYSVTVQGTQPAAIIPASLSMSVTSSENPSGYKDSITFTATETPAVAGNIQFTTNGVNFDSEPLNSGSATSVATTALPRGNNPVTATFVPGNSDYSGSAALIGGPMAGDQTVTNHPPTALNAAYYNRVRNLSLKMLIDDLLTNFTDVDGDALALHAYDSTTTNGTALFDDGVYIYYTNSTPVNVNDAFGYSASDGFGGITTNEVFITIIQTNGQQTPQITVSGNSVSVTFFGVPGYTYDVERNTNLGAGAGWVGITNVLTPAGGVFTITDNFTDVPNPPPASAYYRLLVP
jgi:hypothetical protein